MMRNYRPNLVFYGGDISSHDRRCLIPLPEVASNQRTDPSNHLLS